MLSLAAWRRPERVTVTDTDVRWSMRLGPIVESIDFDEILDAFVLLGRDPLPRSPVGQVDRLRAFVERYGPWGACSIAPSRHHHGPLTGFMDVASSFPLPPQLTSDRPKVARKRESVADVVRSARRLSALRAIGALARIPDDDEDEVDAAGTLIPGLIEALGISSREARRRAAPIRVEELVDRALEGWLRDAHLVPTPQSTFAVGGVSGALALALRAERASGPDVPIRIGLCSECGTTWSRKRSWGTEFLVGPRRLCPTCMNNKDQARHRERKGVR